MQKRRILLIVLALGILIVWRQMHKEDEPKTIHITGTTMGVVPYSIKYMDLAGRDLQNDIDSLLVDFNNSLSTYIPNSEISTFNTTDTATYLTPYLYPMLMTSREIYDKSNGAFDPTIGPLVNAWGFGPEKKISLDSSLIDSLIVNIGFDKVTFDATSAKKNKGVVLDFSATAKGYAVDVIADYILANGIKNFMVEIGGEVVCRGKNENGTYWKIGIEKPEMTPEVGNLFATTFIKNTALATSGNYRNYYQEEGRIISHTISPYTGYSVRHHLLSASIYAPNCALADGYATACMVLGVEKSIKLLEATPEIDGFLIFSKEDGSLDTYISLGVQPVVEIIK
ncbi:thiamine biosynthesis lipoprotein [Reichenbachiella agariperforans]|uniref:FAD:protein FMN transferase n=1 Tax=Reichenbachiella agariperforans TaxID=156994 RepID=A0A1M6NJU0_REIAG|nr:FAD:protein FMN transferase [Reichenbachiella agariperforans]SHJ96005.1 thiamine biosynthesis lipoprotein [Reichenbachiella agariperforans]